MLFCLDRRCKNKRKSPGSSARQLGSMMAKCTVIAESLQEPGILDMPGFHGQCSLTC